MAILRRLGIDGVSEIQLLGHGSWSHVEIPPHNLHKLGRAGLVGPIAFNEDALRLRDADSIRELYKTSPGKLGAHKRFRDPAREIRGRTIDLSCVSSMAWRKTISPT